MPRRFVWHPSRGPAKTAKLPPLGGRVEIRQVRSEIGHPARLRRTLEALGLHHHQDVVTRDYTAAVAGQVKQVRHLVTVIPVEQ